MLNLLSGQSVLEIGCGTGKMYRYFSERAKVSYGVEPGRWGDCLDNIVRDISMLPKDITFDVIVLSDVLEHVSSPTALVRDLQRLTLEGSVIYSNFPNKDSLVAWLRKGMWRMVRPLGHLHYFSSRSIDELFGSAGFKIVKKRRMRRDDKRVMDLLREFKITDSRTPYLSLKILLTRIVLGRDQWETILKRIS
jgi:SAM-dependent methyltransferase